MKPFIILALPRTGTKMLVSALRSHPQIPHVVHEFRGGEYDFWQKQKVLSNYVRPWMLREDIVKIHIHRDPIAGAKSMLLMHYKFPDLSFDLPAQELQDCADFRKVLDAEMVAASDWSVSYDDITEGEQITELPEWFVERFCSMIGIDPSHCPVSTTKSGLMRPRNHEELSSLRV